MTEPEEPEELETPEELEELEEPEELEAPEELDELEEPEELEAPEELDELEEPEELEAPEELVPPDTVIVANAVLAGAARLVATTWKVPAAAGAM